MLEETHEFPAVYLYKFVFKGDNKTMAQIESLFSESAVISTKTSSGGKYMSVSIRDVAINADEILNIYAEVRKIDGVMSL